jgi:cardiolipin synthase
MKWSFLPNALSIARIFLVVPSVLALGSGRFDLTLLVFGIAAVTDGLDGWLAKTFGWTSRLGKILDPIADKVLLSGVLLMLGWLGRAPWWLVVAAVVRDLVIVGGAIAYRVFIGYLEGRPTLISKMNTVLQLIYVLLVIAIAGAHPLPPWIVTLVGAATFVTTVISGLDYVLRYAREAARAVPAARSP